jgi:hypothetical protein
VHGSEFDQLKQMQSRHNVQLIVIGKVAQGKERPVQLVPVNSFELLAVEFEVRRHQTDILSDVVLLVVHPVQDNVHELHHVIIALAGGLARNVLQRARLLDFFYGPRRRETSSTHRRHTFALGEGTVLSVMAQSEKCTVHN